MIFITHAVISQKNRNFIISDDKRRFTNNTIEFLQVAIGYNGFLLYDYTQWDRERRFINPSCTQWKLKLSSRLGDSI